MEFVRWLRGVTPGPYSMTRKTVPLSRVVAVISLALSARPALSTGKPYDDQILAIVAPGRNDTTSREISSIATTALPSPSCAVTTRRIFTAISSQSFVHFPPPSYGGGGPQGRRGKAPLEVLADFRSEIFEHRFWGLPPPPPSGAPPP